MRNVLLLCFVTFLCTGGRAQNTELNGRVSESSGEAVMFATVKVVDAATDEMITGTTTDMDGRFKVAVPNQEAHLEISFLGYSTIRIDDLAGADLENIVLRPDGETLDEVLVTGERSTTEFKLDKRIFNVGKDLSSAGASALEVLNNVPSVTVTIEGQINLRGSGGVQILIDGKPSVLASDGGNALGTITADMIERIEVITNPSAKYEAEGTAGIINIVMKKDDRKGTNGSITVNTGTPDNHSLGFSLNRRTAKFNFFGQLGAGYRSLPEDYRGINRDLTTGRVVNSVGRGFRNEQFYNLNLGTDYYINDLNVITLAGSFAYEVESQPSETSFEVFDAAGNLTDSWSRSEETEAVNPKWQYELNYKRQFDPEDKEHALVISALGSAFIKDQSSEFTTVTDEGAALFGDQLTATDFGEVTYTFKADYTKPFSEAVTLETGLQYVFTDVGNDFETQNFTNGAFVPDPDLTNRFEYDQGVLGAYVTTSYEGERWGVKGGLRVEQTRLNTLLVNTEESNDQDFANLFPSLHSSYKISDAASVQAGYSRRIFRPRLWDLNPFFNVRDNFNVRAGNPDLLPEFTDSYEVTGIFIIGELSLNAGVYHRYTTEVVERVAFFEDNVSITRPINLGTSRANGAELNGKLRVSKSITLSGDLNYNTFNREAELDGVSFDFTANQFNGRLVSKFELPFDVDLEVAGNAQSGVETVQGRVSGFAFMDFGLRKKALKGRLVFNASVRDAFASRIRESEAIQPNFTTYNFNLRGRFITFGVSYGFGKGEAMEFAGRKRF